MNTQKIIRDMQKDLPRSERDDLKHIFRVLKFREKFPRQFAIYKQQAFIESGIVKVVGSNETLRIKLTKRGEEIFEALNIKPVYIGKTAYMSQLKKFNQIIN